MAFLHYQKITALRACKNYTVPIYVICSIMHVNKKLIINSTSPSINMAGSKASIKSALLLTQSLSVTLLFQGAEITNHFIGDKSHSPHIYSSGEPSSLP
jgi:hypothetical protein